MGQPVARSEGFEPPTHRLGRDGSIQLSYERNGVVQWVLHLIFVSTGVL